MALPSRLAAAVRRARSSGSWVWLLPNLVLGLFVVALFALLVVLHRREVETRRNALARDIQWAEQTIRTRLGANQDFLQFLSKEIADGGADRESFRARAARHVAANPELTQIVWVDADQVVRWVAPLETTAWNAGERLSTPEQALAFQRAQRTGAPAYGMPVADADESAAIEVYVPVVRNRTSLGAVVGIYAADQVLGYLGESGFWNKYRVVMETEDRVISANSSVVRAGDLTEIVRLEPPGQGLRLRVSAFAAESNVPRDMLLLLIAGLVLLMGWSLWALGAHMRRRLEAERERDQLFRLSLDLLCVLRVDGRVVRANPAFERVLGVSPEALQDTDLYHLVHPEDLAATAAEVSKLASGEPSTGFQNRCRCADGTYRWLAWSVNPVLAEELLYCVAHDVTDRKRTEDAIRTEAAFRKAMGESVITGLRAVDMDGRITYVNPAFCEMVGWSAEELVGCVPPFPYWPEEEREALEKVTAAWMGGQNPRSGFEIRIRRKTGERFFARLYISPLVGGDGRQTGWMASTVDITEQKRARELSQQQQERLQQTSRLITMGEMASSLAHELNQPLAAVANYCGGCVSRLGSGSYRPEDLLAAMQKASFQAERAGKIIRRMRDFVRKREPNRSAVPLSDIVDEAIGIAGIEARDAGVAIRVDLPTDLPPVYADKIMIEQVVLNLVKNGIEAMQRTSAAQRELTVSARANGGRAVEVAVADRGHGLGADEPERLFAPFYTTKREGMGMGLNICRSIVEFHDGRLWAQPNAGGGAVFRFTLPVEG